MKKLLQINVDSALYSCGKICEDIATVAKDNGWDTYIAYGREHKYSVSKEIKIGNWPTVYEHYFENKIFDNEGLASRYATWKLVKHIKKIKPDIIHLHLIHDHYLNYKILFEYLRISKIPVVWTIHDCWPYTGGCFYYSMDGCTQFMSECVNCHQNRGVLFEKTKRNFNIKKNTFLSIDNLFIIPVSKWLEKEVKFSFFKNIPTRVIYNGIDTDVFKPTNDIDVRSKYNIGDCDYLIAVAAIWDKRKNIRDYLELSKRIETNIKIVLVGLTSDQIKKLPSNIIGIPKTHNAIELAALYTNALAVLNLSLEETFGLTTVEGLSCGTPGIVYNCTASPELISSNTGIIVEKGNVDSLYEAVLKIKSNYYSSIECRERANKYFNKNSNFKEYINLYNELLTLNK